MPLPAAFPGDERLLARLIASSKDSRHEHISSDPSARTSPSPHRSTIPGRSRAPFLDRAHASCTYTEDPSRLTIREHSPTHRTYPGRVPRRQQRLSREIVVVVVLVRMRGVRRELAPGIDDAASDRSVAHWVIGEGLRGEQRWMGG